MIGESLADASRRARSSHLGAVQPRRGPACHAGTACPQQGPAKRVARRPGLAAQRRDPTGCDPELGLRRARAATLLMLALPGSAYLYQGEELGLHEVADIPDDARQDPAFFRSPGVDKGRDGCRVPLPWTTDGPSFGFGPGAAHLPQPAWYRTRSVQVQHNDPESTLHLYRRALNWRRQLQTTERLQWIDTDHPAVLHLVRDGGWHSITNFGPQPAPLPDGTVVVSSAPLDAVLPPNTTAWLVTNTERTQPQHRP